MESLKQKNEVKADFADLGTDIFKLRLFFNNHDNIIIIDVLKEKETPGKIVIYEFHNFRIN